MHDYACDIYMYESCLRSNDLRIIYHCECNLALGLILYILFVHTNMHDSAYDIYTLIWDMPWARYSFSLLLFTCMPKVLFCVYACVCNLACFRIFCILVYTNVMHVQYWTCQCGQDARYFSCCIRVHKCGSLLLSYYTCCDVYPYACWGKYYRYIVIFDSPVSEQHDHAFLLFDLPPTLPHQSFIHTQAHTHTLSLSHILRESMS